jgi:FkbM family methyltransferase
MLSRRFGQLRKALKLMRRRTYRRGLFAGIGAAIEHERLLQSFHFMTIIDAGANIGQFSLLTRTLYPDARIHAFEPLSGPASRYERLFAGDTKTALHRIALGQNDAMAAINVAAANDSSSLLPITDKQIAFAPDTYAVGQEDITIRRLDAVLAEEDIAQPALLKIDVQGYELEVLKGCGQLLQRFAAIYLEASFVELYRGQPLACEIIDFLRIENFHLCGVNSPSFDRGGRCMQADFLFARDDIYRDGLRALSG